MILAHPWLQNVSKDHYNKYAELLGRQVLVPPPWNFWQQSTGFPQNIPTILMLFLVSVCQLDAIKSILSGRLNRVMYLFVNRSNEFKLSSTLHGGGGAAAVGGCCSSGFERPPIERQLHFERHFGGGAVAAAFSTTTAAAKPRHLVSYRILACKMKDLWGRM